MSFNVIVSYILAYSSLYMNARELTSMLPQVVKAVKMNKNPIPKTTTLYVLMSAILSSWKSSCKMPEFQSVSLGPCK